MAFNPLIVILKDNKLVEPNYINRKRNLDIVMTAEEYTYVLTKHQSMPSAYNIMQNLKEIFGHQSCAARQTTIKGLGNTTMAEGTPVRDHVLKMIGLLNKIKILGTKIDGEVFTLQAARALESAMSNLSRQTEQQRGSSKPAS
ncbi:uncharacterized protein LOC131143859 [Malania oleifera]|uniref:uncharacterized protein LOC131143859 n=1 Tax=Malania oleifera TaxID=397392 RepID=UPI0025ADC9D1|nr:uncharacterized protein LOC131143859 [Malania oleifera]